MRNLPDLEAWAIFERVVTTGSFAKAAEALGISQPTVSKAIARLEQRLGSTLLYRTPRRIALTPTGRRAIKRAELILIEAQLMEAEASSKIQLPEGVLQICAPMPLSQSYITPLIAGFLDCYPDIHLDISFADVVTDAASSSFDVILRIVDHENPPRNPYSQLRKLLVVRRVLVASPKYLDRYDTIRHPREVEKHACFFHSTQTTALSWRFRHASGEHCSVPIASKVRTNSAESLLPALLNGLGMAVQPEVTVSAAIERGELVEVLPEWRVEPIYLDLVTPPRVLVTGHITAFVDYVSRNFPVGSADDEQKQPTGTILD